MKKLKIFLLILLMFPIFIKADHSAPMVIQYDARVKNSGATIISLDDWFNGKNNLITIPQGTTFKVTFEEYLNFPTASNNERELLAEIKYNNESYYIKLSDIEPVTNEVDFKKASECNYKFYVYKKGAYLYKGPSTVYGRVDGELEVPVGQVLTCEYTDATVSEVEGWVYVTYNGTSGWVYTNQYCEGGYSECPSVANYSEKQEEVTTIRKAKIYIVENETTKTIADVPKGGKIKIMGSSIFSYLASYNGKVGLVDYELLYPESEKKEIVLKKDRLLYDVDDFYTNVLDTSNEENSNELQSLASIPKGTKLKAHYVETSYYSAYYVTYNGKKGIVTDYFDDLDEEEEDILEPEANETEPELITEENEPTNEEPIVISEEKAESPASIKSRVKYYVIGAIGLALIAIILILLINRKNKKNKVEPVVENNVTEMPVENNADIVPENTMPESSVENSIEVTSENNSVESEQSDQK